MGSTTRDVFTTEINTEWKGLFSWKNIIARKINDRKVCLPTSFSTASPRPARTLRTLSSDPPPRSQSYPLAPVTSPIRSILLLSPLWLPPVHASPIHHYRAAIVVPSIPRRSFLAFLSRSQPSWLHGKAHSSRGSTNSQLRSFTSTWLPTLTSTLESLPPAPSLSCTYDRICGRISSCTAMQFLRVFLVNLSRKPIMRNDQMLAFV